MIALDTGLFKRIKFFRCEALSPVTTGAAAFTALAKALIMDKRRSLVFIIII
jgi:hypothetical protein